MLTSNLAMLQRVAHPGFAHTFTHTQTQTHTSDDAERVRSLWQLSQRTQS